jgi:hypothetical protein
LSRGEHSDPSCGATECAELSWKTRLGHRDKQGMEPLWPGGFCAGECKAQSAPSPPRLPLGLPIGQCRPPNYLGPLSVAQQVSRMSSITKLIMNPSIQPSRDASTCVKVDDEVHGGGEHLEEAARSPSPRRREQGPAFLPSRGEASAAHRAMPGGQARSVRSGIAPRPAAARLFREVDLRDP